MKTLEEAKAEFNYWFPEWMKILSNKNVRGIFVGIFLLGCGLSVFSRFIMWIFAIAMGLFVILAFYGMITRELDNYRIRRLCKENGWTIEQWNQ